MKTKYFLLTSAIFLTVSGCAPQTRTISYATGVQTQERLSVPINGELRLGFYVGTIRDDCSQFGRASVKPVTEPSHGRILIRETTDIPRFVGTIARTKCSGKAYPGTLATYRPAPGYSGEDQFSIDIIWPTGASRKRSITVQVR